MEYSSREEVIHHLQQSFQTYIDEYEFDDIGIFEEEGQENQYYMGYTIEKYGAVYHVHSPFKKTKSGGLVQIEKRWMIESEDPQKTDLTGFNNLESAFENI